jgi:hypothetical protein
MSLSNEPINTTLAPYVPSRSEPRRLDDSSFSFGEGESLKGVWRVIRKRKKTIVVGGLCGLALAFLICLLMGRQYAAIATVEVEKTDASQASLLSSSDAVPPSAEGLKTFCLQAYDTGSPDRDEWAHTR